MKDEHFKIKSVVYESALIEIRALIPEGKGFKRDQKAFDDIRSVIDRALSHSCRED